MDPYRPIVNLLFAAESDRLCRVRSDAYNMMYQLSVVGYLYLSIYEVERVKAEN